MARQMTERQAAAFARLLASEAHRPGGVMVRDLGDATGMLWGTLAVMRQSGAAFERAMREVDEHTKGQPFRLDTPDGPLFLDVPLWRFAGCSGVEVSDELEHPYKRRPTWDGDSRASEAA